MSRPVSATRTRRLAVVSDAVHPWNTGGKEKRHHELLTRLVDRGYAVDVYTMRWWGSEPEVTRDGVRYVAICPLLPLYAGPRRSIRQALVFCVATLRLLTRRYDVLEADAIPFLQLFPLRAVTWLRRRPMVVTWHEFWGRDYWVQYLGARGRLAAWLERTAVRLPDRIIAASPETGARLTAHGVDVHVIPNGVEVRTPPEAEVAAIAGDGAELVTVGRLLDHKRVDHAVRAVGLLRDRGRPLRLDVIGQGPDEARLRALVAELDLGDLVRITGFVDDHAALLARMAAARLLVFPSVREGFGMVALEAMAVGTPVVTSDHPDNATRHLVVPGVNGEHCAPTPAALADAVETALAGREALVAGALDTARDYDWDRLADDAGKVYSL